MSDNMYDHLHHTTPLPFCSYSEPNDDISIFLTQILLKSSSSSLVTRKQFECEFQQPGTSNIPVNPVARVSSSSSSSLEPGSTDFDRHEYSGETEEGFENVIGEMMAKPKPSRSSTKRTRAAEFHNLSEKRRRSRINEKMKALQKLIPNSNKSDKASMLDEAIEYLKQLQLQVQALTMRNGINWYTLSASHGAPHPNQNQNQNENQTHRALGIYQGTQSMNMTMNQERLVNAMVSHNQPSALDFSGSIYQGPFGTRLESS